MNEMMTWVSPKSVVQRFAANDHVALCTDTTSLFYKFVCMVKGTGNQSWDSDGLGDLYKYKNQDIDFSDPNLGIGVQDSTNLFEDGWSVIVGQPNEYQMCSSGDNTYFIKAEDAKFAWDDKVSASEANIWKGWFDNNSWDIGPDMPEANVFIWRDGNEYHAAYDLSTFSTTTPGNFSK